VFLSLILAFCGFESHLFFSVQIKDLPQEMPAEWSALLHGLDQTLQEMGEQTLDTKDAVFAVNALLMASTEVSQTGS
jgi:hypothetical protein